MIFKQSEKWANKDVHFSNLRALFIDSLDMLVVSDLHLGKSGHFQQMGAAVPADIHANDLANLKALIIASKASKLLINGDLFHAGITRDVPFFKAWMASVLADSSLLNMILVKGNHDKFADVFYYDLGFHVVENFYNEGDYLFIHDPDHLHEFEAANSTVSCHHFIFGHVHAGVVLQGKGRQKIRHAAFVIEQRTPDKSAVYLPAFGTLTGIKTFNLSANNHYLLTSEDHLFEL